MGTPKTHRRGTARHVGASLAVMFLVLAATPAYAHAATSVQVVDGLVYRLDPSTHNAAIAFPESDAIKVLKVPAKVAAKGAKYTVTGIEARAFEGCSRLTRVTGGAKLVVVGKRAFRSCGKLKSVTITSKSLATLGKKAFAKCPKLVRFNCASKLLKASALRKACVL